MKKPVLIVALLLAALLALAAMAYRPVNRWLAQRQVDQLIVKGPATRELFAKDPGIKREVTRDAFLEFACAGDWQAATAFVRAGHSVNIADGSGLTPLHCAAARGNLDFARDLVDAGADIKARTNELELTPIHYAVWYREWALARYLASKGASINEASKIGPPALLAMNDGAAWRTDHLWPKITKLKRPKASLAADVKELQSLGAALDAAGPDGTTMLHWAARAQDVNLMSLLVDKAGLSASVKNARGTTPLMFAFSNSPWQASNGEGSHVATVKWLLERGVEINARDEDGASIALDAVRNPELLELLGSELDLDVADDQGRSIWTVLGTKAVAFARTQPSIAVPRMTDGRTGTGPLHVCAKHASLDCIEYFLQRGVSPNQTDQDGLTALHVALASSGGSGNVAVNRPLIVKALLAAGADVNATGKAGISQQ
ncbi:MAG: ankyrin repeat domain-containing protein [Rhodocyclales bacterium]|nr:ankyrin repeat domain-containing protein [Rhodocyclales bacterium]